MNKYDIKKITEDLTATLYRIGDSGDDVVAFSIYIRINDGQTVSYEYEKKVEKNE